MNTTPTSMNRRPMTPRVDLGPTTCGCGQDLVLVDAGHCPRCGTQLGAARVEAVGFWRAA